MGAYKHNYEILEQSLEVQMAADTDDMNEYRAVQAGAEESKTTAEGNLEQTVKVLANAEEALTSEHSNCMQTLADHVQTVKSREKELSHCSGHKDSPGNVAWCSFADLLALAAQGVEEEADTT